LFLIFSTLIAFYTAFWLLTSFKCFSAVSLNSALDLSLFAFNATFFSSKSSPSRFLLLLSFFTLAAFYTAAIFLSSFFFFSF